MIWAGGAELVNLDQDVLMPTRSLVVATLLDPSKINCLPRFHRFGGKFQE
jgi:hypothetical protein